MLSAAGVLVLAADEAAAAAPEPPAEVEVRAGLHGDFGRLVLDWPAPVSFEDEAGTDQLVLRFARPLRAEFGDAARHLEPYLRDLARSDDGREVRLLMQPAVEPRLRDLAPDLVVVDLRRSEDLPEVARAASPVGLRTGVHDGFARIVFDWPEPVGVRVERAARRLALTFDATGTIDAAMLRDRLGSWLEGASARAANGRSRVDLDLARGLTAEVFESDGGAVVVDLVEDAALWRAAAGESVQTVTPAADAREGAADGGTTEPPVTRSADVPSPEPAPLDVTLSPAEDGVRITFAWPAPVPAAVFVRAGHLWALFDRPRAADGAPFPPPIDAAFDADLGPGEVLEAGSATALRFPLSRELAAEVRREGGAWHVRLAEHAGPPRPVAIARLEEPPRMRLEAEGGGVIEVTDPEVGDRLRVWPLLASGVGLPRARRLVDLDLLASAQGVVWRPRSDSLAVARTAAGLDFAVRPSPRVADAPDGPASPSGTRGGDDGERRAAADGPASVEPGRLHGEPATIEFPGTELSGIELPRPELSGAEIPSAEPADTKLPGIDPTDAEPVDTEVAEREPPDPDALPAVEERRGAEEMAEVDGAPLDLAAFALPPGAGVADQKARLMRRLERAPPGSRARARLDVARFFLAQAMAAETLAVLRSWSGEADAPAAPLELARQSLYGAAELLMGHLRAADEALGAPALDGDPEIALWRAALAAARDDWSTAARELGRSEGTLETYPPPLQLRLGLPAALIAVETGQPARAFSLLERLAGLDLHTGERNRVDFIRGLAHARAGALDEADAVWRALERDAEEETRVKAIYARTTTLLDAGRIAAAVARVRLEDARPLWRGHPWELTMLDALAAVQDEGGDPAGAIRTRGDAVRRFPDAAMAEAIEEEMRAGFAEALADGIDPVRALALYRDFPELVPEGAEGDRLRRRLAGRLVAIDLIEPAAEILSGLVESGSPGAATAAAGADLAALWLKDARAEEALAALDATAEVDRLPADLAGRRELLRARALAAADRSDAALAVLGERDDLSARRLRADIHWRERAWSEVVRSTAPLVDEAEAAGGLDPEAQALLVRLATAHSRLGAEDALERLRRRFGPAMRDRPFETAFLVATMTGPGAVEPEAILAAAARRIGDLRALLGREAGERGD